MIFTIHSLKHHYFNRLQYIHHVLSSYSYILFTPLTNTMISPKLSI